MVEYKKFKINEFFKVLRVRHKLTKSQLLSDGKYPCYSSETSNYGILGYTNTPEFHVDDDHSYLIFGDHTRSMRIAETDFSVLDNVKVLKGPKLSGEILLYIETAWHKGIRDMGYARHWKIAKQSDFLLPVTSAGQPDFEYMSQYIKDLERQCVGDLKTKQKEELQAYLQVTGFTDMALSSSEAAALTKKVVWKKFRIGSLFEKKTVRGYPKKLEDLTPVSNGYHTFGQNIHYQHEQRILMPERYLFNVDRPILAYASSTGSVGMINESFYRSGDNGAFQALLPKFDDARITTMLFILTIMKRVFMNFNYNTNIRGVLDLSILLPVTSTGEIDFT